MSKFFCSKEEIVKNWVKNNNITNVDSSSIFLKNRINDFFFDIYNHYKKIEIQGDLNLEEDEEEIPKNIVNNTKLITLSIYNIGIKTFIDFYKFDNLRNLQLTNNGIESLSEFFCNLSNLKYLSLNNNNLKSLPESFGNLSNLKKLFLDNNKLESLPESFCNLSNLKNHI